MADLSAMAPLAGTLADAIENVVARVPATREAVIGEHVSVEKLAKPYAASTLARYRVTPAPGPGIGDITKL